MTYRPPAATLTRAEKRIEPRHLRELLAASAELLDAAAFGDRAMEARRRIAVVLRSLAVYPPAEPKVRR